MGMGFLSFSSSCGFGEGSMPLPNWWGSYPDSAGTGHEGYRV